MSITIRNAADHDLAAITKIYGDSVLTGTASFEEAPPSEAEMRRRHQSIVADGYPYLVAIDESGELAGYCYASRFRGRPAYRHTVEDSIYLNPAYFGRGVARQLLTQLIAECSALGFRQMLGIVGDAEHADRSIKLHEACGFDHVGVLRSVGFKHGSWCNTVYLQRALGDGDTTPPASD